ncbi:MAG: PIG-L family deacetylase, partial [Acidimicrobiia bacterium]|nr:PIG-L family deacetylase [Acidimicrobiia bacterium]
LTFAFAEPPRHIVCLGAHPDDIEIGALGTILTLAERYPEATFTFVVLTGSPPRLQEAAESASAALGDRVTLHTAGFRDNVLPYEDPVAAKAFARDAVADAGGVDLVLAPRREDAHQDHRFVADLAAQLFRGPTILGYEIAKFDGDLTPPNVFVGLDEAIVERKLDHLDRHFPSQHDKPWYTRDAFAALLRIRGIEALSDSEFAEAFHGAKVTL